MSDCEVTRNIWRNSLSNYISVGLRMVLGLFMFRMLYQGLNPEEFGFWSLLWSVFGYGILLDFGFGFTAVKRVAELSVHEKWEQLSRVLSTIFYLYVGLGLVIIASVLLGSHLFIRLFQITPGNQEYFRQILVYFFVGMGITFPLGIFPEILIGQQRLYLSNIIFSCGLVCNFIMVCVAMHYHWGLKRIVFIALASAIIPCIVAGFFGLKALRHVHLRPRFFSVGMIRETLSFSVFAYIGTISNIILGKTDQLVLSTALAVSAVAIYQAGAKVGEMFGNFTQQLPDTFSSAAAHLHARGDRDKLQQLLVNGTRFSVMIATPAYFIGAFYMEGILRLLTGRQDLGPETFWIGQVLLLWQYMTLITQSVTKRIFMMTGHEKRLMWLGVGEAAFNLALSVGLVLYFKNVVCVAIGSLVATTFFGWFYIWPWAAREARMTGWLLARTVLFPIWLACIPLVGFIGLCRFMPWLDFRTSTVLFLVNCTLAGLVAFVSLWRGALTSVERATFLLRVGKIFTRRNPA
jgi:O-antigen/teichoic acid export membrane protein